MHLLVMWLGKTRVKFGPTLPHPIILVSAGHMRLTKWKIRQPYTRVKALAYLTFSIFSYAFERVSPYDYFERYNDSIVVAVSDCV